VTKGVGAVEDEGLFGPAPRLQHDPRDDRPERRAAVVAGDAELLGIAAGDLLEAGARIAADERGVEPVRPLAAQALAEQEPVRARVAAEENETAPRLQDFVDPHRQPAVMRLAV